MKSIALCVSVLVFSVGSALAQSSYVTPPTTTTRGHVPVISDETMKQCVEVYNQAKWLQSQLQSTSVDRYSQSSVDQYNAKVNELNRMTDWFNRECAGKQSRSACKAAQELNRQKGLPVHPCN